MSRESGALRLTINPINDRPTLSGIRDITPAVDEDVAMYGPFTMQALLSAFGATYTEVEVADSENLLIYNVQNQQGVWQFRAGGSWNPIHMDARGASSTHYMVLQDIANHQIRYVPNAHANTAINPIPSLSVRAWDDTQRAGTTTGGTILVSALTGDQSSETEGSVSREFWDAQAYD